MRRKYKYTVFQETDDTLFMFFDKMKKKNNELNINNCSTQNPEDIWRKKVMWHFIYRAAK